MACQGDAPPLSSVRVSQVDSMHGSPDQLAPRARHLLRTLIARYIQDGEPVGSQTLARVAGLEVSPATIRNIPATWRTWACWPRRIPRPGGTDRARLPGIRRQPAADAAAGRGRAGPAAPGAGRRWQHPGPARQRGTVVGDEPLSAWSAPRGGSSPSARSISWRWTDGGCWRSGVRRQRGTEPGH